MANQMVETASNFSSVCEQDLNKIIDYYRLFTLDLYFYVISISTNQDHPPQKKNG